MWNAKGSGDFPKKIVPKTICMCIEPTGKIIQEQLLHFGLFVG